LIPTVLKPSALANGFVILTPSPPPHEALRLPDPHFSRGTILSRWLVCLLSRESENTYFGEKLAVYS